MGVLDLCASISVLSTSGIITIAALRLEMSGNKMPSFLDLGTLTVFLAVFTSNIVIRFVFENVFGEISNRLESFTRR